MLYVCPTPIGNLGDVTLRVLDVLRTVDLVACEDTRRTRGLLEHFEIQQELISFYEHNERRRIEALLPRLREGAKIALVSDAGMPGLSDPGFTLVRACLEEGIPVTVLPGASAISTALVASGLPTDRFVFAGFLPRGARHVAACLEEAGRAGGTIVCFESPQRLRETLETVARRWPDRRLAVCRELTKLHEEVLRGTATEVLVGLGERVRGEIVLVLEAAAEEGRLLSGGGPRVDEEQLRQTLRLLLDRGLGVKEASVTVAHLAGIPSRRVYAWAVEIRQGGGLGP